NQDDLQAISEDCKITSLGLRNCNLTDISLLLPLADTLVSLDIKGNDIKDFSVLKKFRELTILFIDADEKTKNELKQQLEGVYID
ncbi:MAG: hypothetical protein K0S55_1878, partial [Clostridia bacterium]|nr:hypothetical protein [Clostridia bacterium]